MTRHFVSLLLLLSLPAQADTLGAVRQALAELPGTVPVRGQLEVKVWRKAGNGPERTGQATAWVEEGQQGLRLQFGRDVLARLAAEAQARQKAPEAPTPTTLGVDGLEPRDVADQLNAAPALARQLEGARLKAEGTEPWNGQPARVLTLELPLSGVGERERKYIKEHQVTAKLWLASDGTPLGARTSLRLKGRAFMVVSFNQEVEEAYTFAKVGDRLVCVAQETKQSGGGGGESGSSRTVRSFRLQ